MKLLTVRCSEVINLKYLNANSKLYIPNNTQNPYSKRFSKNTSRTYNPKSLHNTFRKTFSKI